MRFFGKKIFWKIIVLSVLMAALSACLSNRGLALGYSGKKAAFPNAMDKFEGAWTGYWLAYFQAWLKSKKLESASAENFTIFLEDLSKTPQAHLEDFFFKQWMENQFYPLMQDFKLAFLQYPYKLPPAAEQAILNYKQGMPLEKQSFRSNPFLENNHIMALTPFLAMAFPGDMESQRELLAEQGSLISWGDGYSAAFALAHICSNAYLSSDMVQIAESMPSLFHSDSYIYGFIKFVTAYWRGRKDSFGTAYRKLTDNWDVLYRSPGAYFDKHNQEARMNLGFLMLALLYGQGNWQNSMENIIFCGGDKLGNAAAAGMVLGAQMGMTGLKQQQADLLNINRYFLSSAKGALWLERKKFLKKHFESKLIYDEDRIFLNLQGASFIKVIHNSFDIGVEEGFILNKELGPGQEIVLDFHGVGFLLSYSGKPELDIKINEEVLFPDIKLENSYVPGYIWKFGFDEDEKKQLTIKSRSKEPIILENILVYKNAENQMQALLRLLKELPIKLLR